MLLRDTLLLIVGSFAAYDGLSAVPPNDFHLGVGVMLLCFGLWEFALRLRRRGL